VIDLSVALELPFFLHFELLNPHVAGTTRPSVGDVSLRGGAVAQHALGPLQALEASAVA